MSGSTPARRIYRMSRRPSGPGGAFDTFSLIVPVEIGTMLRDRGYNEFIAELTEEGLLYRPLRVAARVGNIPEWLRDGE